MDTAESSQQLDPDRKHRTGVQRLVALAVAAGCALYIVLVLAGVIKAANRLNAPDVGVLAVCLIAIAMILRPDFLDRLQKLDFAGLNVELGEVKKEQVEVKKQQEQQAAVLDDVRLALRLLIGNNEQKHLMNLFRHKADNYRVTGALRDEIRRLRAMKLVRTLPNQTVSGIPNNISFDLADYVELTEDGRKFASRLIDEPDDRRVDSRV